MNLRTLCAAAAGLALAASLAACSGNSDQLSLRGGSALQLAAGSSGQERMTLQASGGLGGPVQLSEQVLSGTGVSYGALGFAPAQVSLPVDGTLPFTLTVSSLGRTGTYLVTVTASAGMLASSQQFAVQVSSAP